MGARLFIVFMRGLAYLPLPLLRALGWILGRMLYRLAARRRRVVLRNLSACFADKTDAERLALAQQVFVYFAQSWLDRSWLWHGSEALLQQRLRWVGDTTPLQQDVPTVIFAPHFMGLDAGGVALMMQRWHPLSSIYSRQQNPQLDAWVRNGRNRFGNAILADRTTSIRAVINAMRREHAHFYLLPDMDLGADDALFIPFLGVNTATVPSLSRFARMGGAQVLSMVSTVQAHGYNIHVSPVWADFPSSDLYADTRRMNAELEKLIHLYGAAQYYWVHKRFKTRPTGEPAFYE
jgi:KDO2-lipid IV(A) lauroyltransferase